MNHVIDWLLTPTQVPNIWAVAVTALLIRHFIWGFAAKDHKHDSSDK